MIQKTDLSHVPFSNSASSFHFDMSAAIVSDTLSYEMFKFFVSV